MKYNIKEMCMLFLMNPVLCLILTYRTRLIQMKLQNLAKENMLVKQLLMNLLHQWIIRMAHSQGEQHIRKLTLNTWECPSKWAWIYSEISSKRIQILGIPFHWQFPNKSKLWNHHQIFLDEYVCLQCLSLIESKKVHEALQDADWIVLMQELNQFARSKVWHLVPKPKGGIIIHTK